MFVLRKGTQMSMFRFKDSNQLHSHFVSLQEQIKIRKTKDKAPQSTHMHAQNICHKNASKLSL